MWEAWEDISHLMETLRPSNLSELANGNTGMATHSFHVSSNAGLSVAASTFVLYEDKGRLQHVPLTSS